MLQASETQTSAATRAFVFFKGGEDQQGCQQMRTAWQRGLQPHELKVLDLAAAGWDYFLDRPLSKHRAEELTQRYGEHASEIFLR